METGNTETWKMIKKIKSCGFFNKDPCGKNTNRFKTEDHPVTGIVETDEGIFIYIHENYFNFHSNKSSNIVRYKLSPIV